MKLTSTISVANSETKKAKKYFIQLFLRYFIQLFLRWRFNGFHCRNYGSGPAVGLSLDEYVTIESFVPILDVSVVDFFLVKAGGVAVVIVMFECH